MPLASLSPELFFAVVCLLPPGDIVLCRRVSKRWQAAFSSPSTCRNLLRIHFPCCREIRQATDCTSVHETDWGAAFAAVARRYYNLCMGRPGHVEKIHSYMSSMQSSQFSPYVFRGVRPWDRYCGPRGSGDTLLSWEAEWTYSSEDALLIYPVVSPVILPGAEAPCNDAEGPLPPRSERCFPYRIRDLVSGTTSVVPFNVAGRIMRRVRLAHGVLVLEWAKPAGGAAVHHTRLDEGAVHYATMLDVRRQLPSGDWDMTARGTLEISGDVLPLGNAFRYFTAHTATHYAVYSWMCLNQQTDEQLHIFDIRPGQFPVRSTVTPSHLADSRPVFHVDKRGLQFYRLVQGFEGFLRGLALDEHNVYVLEESRDGAEGVNSLTVSYHPVRATAIPVIPYDPGGGRLLLDRDRDRGASEGEGEGESSEFHPPYGPFWASGCEGPQCEHACQAWHWTRVVQPDVQGPSLAHSGPFGVWPSGAVPLAQLTLRSFALPPLLVPPPPPPATRTTTCMRWDHRDEFLRNSPAVAGGDGGFAESSRLVSPAFLPPCWRHEKFPLMTLADVVDAPAGVRFAARSLPSSRTWTNYLSPSLSVELVHGVCQTTIADCEERGTWRTRQKKQSLYPPRSPQAASAGSPAATTAPPPPFSSVYLDQRLWDLLMGGFVWDGRFRSMVALLAGDERWIVGQDKRGAITIVSF